MKKTVSILLAILLVLSVIPVTATQAKASESNYELFGDAIVLADNSIELTSLSTWKVGGVWYKNKLDAYNGIQVEFSYWAGGGRDNYYGGADGLVLLFSNNTYNLGEAGGALGFVNDSALGIEFDSYPHNSGDPNQKHVALVRDRASNHLTSVNENRVDDSTWHNVVVTIRNSNVSVVLDGEEVLSYSGIDFLSSELYVGFAASTGDGLNRHMIKDMIIRNHDTYETLIMRVKQYTYNGFTSDDLINMANSLDLSVPYNYNYFAKALNDAKNSRKENKDYLYLTNNSLYLAYHLKNELNTTKDRVVLGLGSLIFSGETVSYLVGEWPEKDKYKTALQQYMKATSSDYEVFTYIADTIKLLEAISQNIADPLEKSRIDDLISQVGKSHSVGHVKTLLYEFNFDLDENLKEVVKYNNNRLAKALGVAGDAINIIEITAEGIANLMSVSSNLGIYEQFEDFLSDIATETSLPVALRVAANELNQDLTAQYLNAITEIGQEVGKFIVDKGVSLAATELGSVAASAVIGSVLAGISIGTIIGNILFGVDDYLKACAYIECYSRLSEFFSNRLQAKRDDFLKSETIDNAKAFQSDYITLWNLRLIGEETFRDMLGFEHLWSKTMQHLMRSMKGYYANKAFIDSTISELHSRKFTMINDIPYGELEFKGQYLREIYFACPVNVYVYNNVTGEMIGSIEDGNIKNKDTSKLPLVLYVEGESNHVMIPENADYRIEILATDNGTMMVSNDLINNQLELSQKTNYYNVELQKGKYHIINPDSIKKIDYDSVYFSNDNGLYVIEPSEIISSNELLNEKINVNVVVNGGGAVYGDGKYNKGDYINLIANPIEGYKFVGWVKLSSLISTNNELGLVATEDLSIEALFEKFDKTDTYNLAVNIKNNTGSKTINYGETLKLTAIVTEKPDYATIVWYVDGVKKGEGETFDVLLLSGSAEVSVKLVDENGEVLTDLNGDEISDYETVSVNASFWWKVVSFFKNLFRISRMIIQSTY